MLITPVNKKMKKNKLICNGIKRAVRFLRKFENFLDANEVPHVSKTKSDVMPTIIPA
ncbi:MAG: hypothetical protein BWY12_00909 [candidate division BRC1 bacterium ADurb.Bin183]|nr:MAG: hypothetical protein BWY12_00909 [candidate division BRC1 bacterium ADurb.Bin183]